MSNLKPLIIIGTGGLSKEIVFLLSRQVEYQLVGFVDDNNESESFFGCPVLGSINYLLEKQENVNVVIGIAHPETKMKIYKKLCQHSWLKFPTLIDSTALLGVNVSYGLGNIFMANTTYTADITIGDFNLINIASTIGHDCRIGSYNSVFPSVNISGNVCIGNSVQLGVGTKVIQNISIGNNSITGAGSVVIRDIKSNQKVVGVPAKVIESWNNCE